MSSFVFFYLRLLFELYQVRLLTKVRSWDGDMISVMNETIETSPGRHRRMIYGPAVRSPVIRLQRKNYQHNWSKTCNDNIKLILPFYVNILCFSLN